MGARSMKLTPAQFATLHTLNEFGSKTATEIVLPPAMDGSRKVKLQWNVANQRTLAVLEAAGLVVVSREPARRPVNAVGRNGHARRALTISITDAGRAALDTN